jgi:hypothetical protein
VYVWMNVIPDSDLNCVHPQGEVDSPYRKLVEELRDRVRSLEEVRGSSPLGSTPGNRRLGGKTQRSA